MRKNLLVALILSVIATLLPYPTPVLADRGVPGSPDFGYGARVELEGAYLDEALELAADIPLDWIGITLRWSSLLPGGAYQARLDRALTFAGKNNLHVVISLTDAPQTAQTATGPDPAKITNLLGGLSSQYPGVIAAVELFPAANTRAGWGTAPDPAAYARLFNALQAQLPAAGMNLLLVSGGLQPVAPGSQGDAMDDAAFLQGVYQSGAYPSVVGLALNTLAADPLAPPDASNPNVLRHYETIRQVMKAYNQENSLIWITAFRPPSGTIQSSDGNSLGMPQPESWLYQAYAQIRSQLYIGVVIYQSLNPADLPSASYALVASTQQYHPFVPILRGLVSQNGGILSLPRYGRPKNEGLTKQPRQ